MTGRLEGLPFGCRVLMQLVASVAELSGQEAVSKLSVVLHLGEHQHGDVLSDILSRKLYG